MRVCKDLLLKLSITHHYKLHSIRPIRYHSHPQKTTLDKEELSNYSPILNLSVISKKQYEQRVVKSRLTEDLSTNNLLNPH